MIEWFTLSLLLTHFYIKLAHRLKIVAVDVHKKNKPKVANCGGVVAVPLILLYFLINKEYELFVSTLLFFIYGILDDLRLLNKYSKLVISCSIAAFLSTLSGNPFLFPLVVCIGNAVNSFAGFNGLEVGLSVIILLFSSQYIPALILLAFLYFNFYPARVFPGNCGTLGIGGVFAGLFLFKHMYFLLPMFSLHFSDALIKLFSKKKYFTSDSVKSEWSCVDDSNRLVAGRGYSSLSKILIERIRPKEYELVLIFYLLQIVLSALLLYIFKFL